MNSSLPSPLERLAAALAEGARRELYLTPKPGLVDLADNGSHPDLSLAIMEASIDIVEDYLSAAVASLEAGEPFACQRALGMEAERRMYAELGTNTHKGFIFLAGVLLVARHRAAGDDEAAVRAALVDLAGEFFADGDTPNSNGCRARRKYHVGGIVGEARRGLPSLFAHALPAYRQAIGVQRGVETAGFAMLARLMQTVEDTTTLHRGGPQGLVLVRRDGRALARLIGRGGDPRPFLRERNREYIRLNLTMGGIADLFGLAAGWLIYREAVSGRLGQLPARRSSAKLDSDSIPLLTC